MKQCYSFVVLLIIGLLANQLSTAQISQGGIPESFKANAALSAGVVPTVIMPSVDVAELRAQDSVTDHYKDIPWRFGQNIDVKLNMTNSGIWDDLPNGDKIWRLRIYSKGATSINLTFDNYRLPAGAKLFVYNDAHSDVIGAFTDFNNRDDKAFATTLVKGEAITLEYFEPAKVTFPGVISISMVTHGYRGVKDYMKAFGDAGSCQVNVHCPMGVGWENEIRSVCMLVSGGNGFCSGALVNNTANDGTPYILTANHCYSNPANWVFWFNWEAPTCTQPSSSPSYNSISGGTLKARNVGSDFCLVQMSSTPPSNYNVYYAGWTRDTVHPASGMGIHHPSADIKKISNAGLFHRADAIDEGNGAADCWMVNWAGTTCTEPGSSGSPIFDANHHLRGQLYGGPSACGATQMYDYYGRFYVSWIGGGTSATRLSNWLDPGNTNDTTINGYDPNASAPPVANFAANVTTSCTGIISFTDQSSGSPTSWSWDFGDLTTSAQQSPTHTYTANGTYTVVLIATNNNGSNTVTKTSYITINMPTAPAVAGGDTICNSGSTILSATGNGTLKWYDSMTGGNLLMTGNSYTTPVINTTTVYWVEDSVAGNPVNGGKPDNTGGGGYLTNQNQYLNFDCFNPMTLVSVSVYADSIGNRTFELRNSSGTVLQSAVVNITSALGAFVVPLNFSVPTGTSLQLGLKTNSKCNLYRNNAGVTYPYTTTGLFSITGSSAGATYYYYMYNWVVIGAGCISPRQPDTALVVVCGGIKENDGSGIFSYPNPAHTNIYLKLYNAAPEETSITVFSNLGQIVYKANPVISSSDYKSAISVEGWPAGLYIVRIQNGDKTYYRKVAVE